MKRLLLVALLVVPGVALGQVAADAALVSWVAATQLTDGSPIPSTGPLALKDTQVARSICNADGTFGVSLATQVVPPTTLESLFTALPNGIHCFHARHTQNNGGLSAWSSVVRKTLPVLKAKPPSGVVVQ